VSADARASIPSPTRRSLRRNVFLSDDFDGEDSADAMFGVRAPTGTHGIQKCYMTRIFHARAVFGPGKFSQFCHATPKANESQKCKRGTTEREEKEMFMGIF